MLKVKNRRLKALIKPYKDGIDVKLIKDLRDNTYEVTITKGYNTLNKQRCSTIFKAAMYFKLFINQAKKLQYSK